MSADDDIADPYEATDGFHYLVDRENLGTSVVILETGDGTVRRFDAVRMIDNWRIPWVVGYYAATVDDEDVYLPVEKYRSQTVDRVSVADSAKQRSDIDFLGVGDE